MNFLLGLLIGYLLFSGTNKKKGNNIIYCKQPTYKRPPRKI